MRIEFLQIFTSNLQKQKNFYRNVLQLTVNDISERSFQIDAGFSILEFQEKKGATPYHIAFHIPPLQEEKALKWLKHRVLILNSNGDEIVDFPAWKARSIYFYDADNNVLEFISRKDLFPVGSSEFSEHSVLGIAEIGLATGDVSRIFTLLNEKLSLKKFTGDYEKFCATGDDEGLFIVINKNLKDWFPSDDKAFPSEFKIKIALASRRAELAYTNERLRLL